MRLGTGRRGRGRAGGREKGERGERGVGQQQLPLTTTTPTTTTSFITTTASMRGCLVPRPPAPTWRTCPLTLGGCRRVEFGLVRDGGAPGQRSGRSSCESLLPAASSSLTIPGSISSSPLHLNPLSHPHMARSVLGVPGIVPDGSWVLRFAGKFLLGNCFLQSHHHQPLPPRSQPASPRSPGPSCPLSLLLLVSA